MADNKFQEMLEHLVNEDREKAEEIFHDIVVEKSRKIYENLLADEMKEDDEENVDEASKDEEVDEASKDDEEVDEASKDNDEAVDEASKDDKDEDVKEDFDIDEL